MKILFSAYAISPERGSEPGFAARLISELMVRDLSIDVLTSDRYRTEWDDEWIDNSNVRIHIVSDATHVPFDRGHFGVYYRYRRWQLRSVEMAQALRGDTRFDLAHHYSWGALHFGSPLSRLGIPLVFGPVGGGSVMNPYLRGQLRAGDQIFEIARAIAVRGARLNPLFAPLSATQHCSSQQMQTLQHSCGPFHRLK
jgi:hypothetical protein